MFGFVILAMLTIAGGAFALRTGRVFLQRSADRAEAAAAATRAAADEAVAGQAATDARHRAHPDWLVTLHSTLLRTRIHPLEQRQGQLTAERDEIKAELDASPAGPSLVRKLLGYAALLLLPLLFLLSVYQLVPSFYTLSASGPLALFGGVLVAAIEVGIAFALARVLYHPDQGEAAAGAAAPDPSAGHRPGGSLADRFLAMADSGPAWAKAVLAAAMTLTAAGLLVWGQYTWAPAHDVIPLQGQLTVAEQTYAQDQGNGGQQTLLTSDKLGIDPAIATATVPPAPPITGRAAAALPAGPDHPPPADHPAPGHHAGDHRADGHRADAAGPRTLDDLFPPPAPGADPAHPAAGDAEADDPGNRWTDPV